MLYKAFNPLADDVTISDMYGFVVPQRSLELPSGVDQTTTCNILGDFDRWSSRSYDLRRTTTAPEEQSLMTRSYHTHYQNVPRQLQQLQHLQLQQQQLLQQLQLEQQQQLQQQQETDWRHDALLAAQVSPIVVVIVVVVVVGTVENHHKKWFENSVNLL